MKTLADLAAFPVAIIAASFENWKSWLAIESVYFSFQIVRYGEMPTRSLLRGHLMKTEKRTSSLFNVHGCWNCNGSGNDGSGDGGDREAHFDG